MDEEELFFKRFPESKQDQVRQLVSFATLMGLTGKDLVSIGGKLDRIKVAQDLKNRKQIIAGYVVSPIGKDANHSKSEQERKMQSRFKLETANGVYHFQHNHYNGFTVTNPRTKIKVNHTAQYRDWGRLSWIVRDRYNVLMDVHEGLLQLNF